MGTFRGPFCTATAVKRGKIASARVKRLWARGRRPLPPGSAGCYPLTLGLRLGIQIERIRPGHPEQHGRHERMHLTLKQEATKGSVHFGTAMTVHLGRQSRACSQPLPAM
jgi:hypothetical protein